jgi:hypothetical protein
MQSDIKGRKTTCTSVRSPSFDIDQAIELMADQLYGATRTGMIVRDGSARGQQGKLTLMVTSRVPNSRSRRAAKGLRVKIRRRLESKLRVGGDGRRSRIALIEAGFFILVVLTTWVIASVSAWWVPVYVILLVTIFVVPRRRRLLSSASESGAECDAIDIADLEPGLRVDCANGADQLGPVSRSDSDLTSGECVESSDASSDLTATSPPKPRRSRARARKPAQATETVTASVPVVWMQTGPGKFVRVEGSVHLAHSAEIESVSARAYPATDLPAEATQAIPAQTELPAEQEPPKSSGVFPDEVVQICVPDDCASRSDTEEHGIAPAAFGLAPAFNASIERSDGCRSGQVQHSEVETVVRAKARGELPLAIANAGHRPRQPGIPRTWVVQVRRDLVRAVPHAARIVRQRLIRTPQNPRTLVGSCFAPNVSRRDAARRAFGQMLHVRRSLRPRSPPETARVESRICRLGTASNLSKLIPSRQSQLLFNSL